MQLIDGQPVFSATDLVGYLACEHLTALERAVLAGLVERPEREDRELDVIRKRGFEHEARYLAELRRAAGRWSSTIARDDEEERGERIRRQAEETIAAMASGADVIFQATFFDGRWLGYADFLLRVDVPDSAVGLGAVPLRGRRHEAGPPRQGRRRAPDLQLCRAARAHPGGAARRG